MRGRRTERDAEFADICLVAAQFGKNLGPDFCLYPVNNRCERKCAPEVMKSSWRMRGKMSTCAPITAAITIWIDLGEAG